MYTKTPDGCAITLTDAQYIKLMMALGAAATIPRMLHLSLAVANMVNEGNERWTPYLLTESTSEEETR